MFYKSLTEFWQYVDQETVHPGEKLMVMVADRSSQQLPQLMENLNTRGIEFFGGIYPRLLIGGRCESEGFIVQKLAPVYCSIVLPFMMRMKVEASMFADSTALVLVDGLSSKMKDLTDTIYNKLGKQVSYIGGGAGFYDLVHRPCIFDNRGVYKDVLYLCIVKSQALLAIEHGWNKLEGPFYVKKSRDNVLCRLDNDPAFEVYKHVIEEEERITLSKEAFFAFAKDHPFGILQEDGSVIVRDPIGLNEDGDIVCVANIPEGSDVYILKGDKNTLLHSSMKIARYCAEKAPEQYTPLLFDCISRAMFLEDSFEVELGYIQSKLKHTVEGALSIGEISSKSNGELVIHNKSTVVGLLY